MDNLDMIKNLITTLNNATKAYDEGHPYMSDQDWDNLYFSLKHLEQTTGIVLENSPTQKVVYEVVNELNKVEHNHKMLSLEKTKSPEEVNEFLNGKEYLAMCKMDGLTCSLSYKNGRLVSAETRGNGLIGEDILHNARVISSIPKIIPYYDDLVVDGEIICTYTDFENFSSEFKNPRNFASGSIRLLDSNECARRKLSFIAWDIIKGLDDYPLLSDRLTKLKAFDFLVVPYIKGEVFDEAVGKIIQMLANQHKYPIDGCVCKFNDVAYGRSLGETAHHLKNAIAYKFYDETYETEIKEIEWTMGRTGILTPVAVFQPVEIDGSVVERASLHNLSVMDETLGSQAHVGQKVEVYKANMIIPQIASADKDNHDGAYFYKHPHIVIAEKCPICGGPTAIIESMGNVKNLVCTNPDCSGKLINKLDHFCGKKGLDIKGLSKATLEKLLDWGWIENLSDLMTLNNYRAEWIQKPGFGEKSVDKVLNAIENAKFTTLDAFIASLGIPLIGRTVSKELIKHIDTYEEFRQKADTYFDFSKYDGFAESKTRAIWDFDFTEADKIYPYLSFKEVEQAESKSNTCEDLKVVITGKLTQFKNRDALKTLIEEHGGKVVDSVSKNTTLLINNDTTSASTKNLAAQKLDIPIMSEKEFIEKYLIF